MSRNDIVLLAWGSRSMSSVRLPRRARAAARLIAVVVFPTPPFWFAIATIIEGATGLYHPAPPRRPLHLVFSEVVGVQTLQPLVEALGVRLLRRGIEGLGAVDHGFFDVDRRPRAQRERDRIAGPGVDRHDLVVQEQIDE